MALRIFPKSRRRRRECATRQMKTMGSQKSPLTRKAACGYNHGGFSLHRTTTSCSSTCAHRHARLRGRSPRGASYWLSVQDKSIRLDRPRQPARGVGRPARDISEGPRATSWSGRAKSLHLDSPGTKLVRRGEPNPGCSTTGSYVCRIPVLRVSHQGVTRQWLPIEPGGE
jgi:hypothetical protein